MAITLALVTLTAIFTGCTQPAEQPDTAAPQENAAPAPAPTDQPSGDAVEKIAPEAKEAEGKLNGWIDNNSVEIQMTPSDAVAFRVSDVLDQMEGINDGDKVKFSYIQNEQGQMVITKIEKVQ
ncbi:MAG: hypothetical protein K0R84_338 [Clostridia bacterium]|jgi:Cu/Ag efflux protein CusF|nr:hypothetical protein [Clostridia bacterium]